MPSDFGERALDTDLKESNARFAPRLDRLSAQASNFSFGATSGFTALHNDIVLGFEKIGV